MPCTLACLVKDAREWRLTNKESGTCRLAAIERYHVAHNCAAVPTDRRASTRVSQPNTVSTHTHIVLPVNYESQISLVLLIP